VARKRADLTETPGFAVWLVDAVHVVFVVTLFDLFGGGFGNGLLLELPPRRLEGAGLGILGLPGPRLGLRVARDECGDFCQVWTVDVRFIDHVWIFVAQQIGLGWLLPDAGEIFEGTIEIYAAAAADSKRILLVAVQVRLKRQVWRLEFIRDFFLGEIIQIDRLLGVEGYIVSMAWGLGRGPVGNLV
jgi:hypothetical protein